MKNILSFLTLVLVTNFANAQVAQNINDGAYLDPAYKAHHHPKKITFFDLFANLPVRNDVDSVIQIQTPVKSQDARGTCSIFSATALYEAMLVKSLGLPTDLNLSEEWLEYLIMREQGSEGSSSYANFSTLFQSGSPQETLMPYIGQTWTEADMWEGSLASQRCGTLKGFSLKACLLGHYDPQLLYMSDEELNNQNSALYNPEFVIARHDAAQLQSTVQNETVRGSGSLWAGSVTEVKKLLAAGTPVTLDVDFYYGAWNHRLASEKGMTRNMDHWARGIVGYPEEGTVDARESRADRAGHSVVIVGYDDEMVVETEQLMEDGTVQTFKYKGVYFFKNSWGMFNFGAQTEINGTSRQGYGIITQKYAEEYGSFYKLPIEAKMPVTPTEEQPSEN